MKTYYKYSFFLLSLFAQNTLGQGYNGNDYSSFLYHKNELTEENFIDVNTFGYNSKAFWNYDLFVNILLNKDSTKLFKPSISFYTEIYNLKNSTLQFDSDFPNLFLKSSISYNTIVNIDSDKKVLFSNRVSYVNKDEKVELLPINLSITIKTKKSSYTLYQSFDNNMVAFIDNNTCTNCGYSDLFLFGNSNKNGLFVDNNHPIYGIEAERNILNIKNRKINLLVNLSYIEKYKVLKSLNSNILGGFIYKGDKSHFNLILKSDFDFSYFKDYIAMYSRRLKNINPYIQLSYNREGARLNRSFNSLIGFKFDF